MKKTKTKKRLFGLGSFTRRKQLIVVALIMGLVGVSFIYLTRAQSTAPNPPLIANAKTGIDIFVLGDSSDSFAEYQQNAETYLGQFLRNMEKCTKTRFVVGNIDMVKKPAAYPNADSAITAIKNLGGDSDNLGDLRGILPFDTRSNVQNLVVLFSDFEMGDKSNGSATALKQKGSRILALQLGNDKLGEVDLAVVAGPNVDKGSIYSSDVITKPDQLVSQLLAGATKLCKDPPAGNNDGGGSGNDSGDGGSGGSGTGTNGTGSGGGGSSASEQGDSPKAVPKPAPQGTKEEEPPQTPPSPFFDGKQYEIGSDPDAQTPADLVTNPNTALKNTWFYIACIIMAALGITIGTLYYKKLWIFAKRSKK